MVVETLSMLRGRDYQINDKILIRQPTLGEIEKLGEDKYYAMISTFTCTPFDVIAQLDDMKIDFTKITSYQLFCVLYQSLDYQSTKLLFGEIDFSKFRMVNCDDKLELHYYDIVIDEQTYSDIVEYIRKINMLSPPKFTKVANDYTKKKMIEYAHNDLELAKRRKPKSILKTTISRVTNHPYFKYRLDEVWDMKIYAFYDSVSSINIIENSNHLCFGAYSGNLDMSKINKSEFNWLREVS